MASSSRSKILQNALITRSPESTCSNGSLRSLCLKEQEITRATSSSETSLLFSKAANALADAGYGTIGDIIADSPDEVAQKADISLGVARTIQIAADKYLEEISSDA